MEGEIGDIGTGSEIHEEVLARKQVLTTPAEAKESVAARGIDILPAAVGNAHGMSRSKVQGEKKKRVDIERTAEIKSATGMPLTLHGGSGTDDGDVRRAIAAGITIVHIKTELRVAWRTGLENSLAQQPGQVVPYRILSPVVESAKQVVTSRLKLFNCPHAS